MVLFEESIINTGIPEMAVKFMVEPCQFGRSMTGAYNESAIAEFWQHCASLDEWRHHPCLNDPTIDRGRS